MNTKTTVREIDKALVPALRLSEALPCDLEHATGSLRVLLDKSQQTVGFIVEKTNLGDAWESLDPRFFLTTSMSEAMDLLRSDYSDLPPH